MHSPKPDTWSSISSYRLTQNIFFRNSRKLLLYKLMPAEQHFTEPPAHFTEATLIKELEEKLQKLTDKYVKEIDSLIEAKSKEIMTV